MALDKNDDAHKVALEWIKQIITLSSGIIVLSATFISSIFNQLNWSIWLLIISWVLLLLSIVFGLNTISTITYSRIHHDDSWSSGKGKNYACAAKWLFMAGISIFVIFALINFLITIYGKHPTPLNSQYF